MAIYLKSLIWLVSLGGAGYVLMRVTEPSEDKLKKIRLSSAKNVITEAEEKKLLFVKRLKQEAGIETDSKDN